MIISDLDRHARLCAGHDAHRDDVRTARSSASLERHADRPPPTDLEAAVVQGLAIVWRGLLLDDLGLRSCNWLARARIIVADAAVVECPAIVRRGRSSRRRGVIERPCRRRAIIVGHAAVVQSSAVMGLGECGN